MSVIDLAALLASAAAGDGPTDTQLTALTETPGSAWQLLVIAPGDRWEAAHSEGEEHAALVLEGIATWEVGESRQSLGPGHLVVAPTGTRLAVSNDSPSRVTSLITRTRIRPHADADLG